MSTSFNRSRGRRRSRSRSKSRSKKKSRSRSSNKRRRHDNIVVHINGVQGSGKSYICSKLKNVTCVDTDDIMHKVKKKVMNIQGRDFPSKIDKKTLKLIVEIEQDIVNKYIHRNNPIVFVGMTATIPNPTHKFFIKVDDFESVYKRLLLRELEKITTHYSKIKKYIKQHEDVSQMNIYNVSTQSLPFPVTYASFIDDYKEQLKEAKKNKYTPKTQHEIIHYINKL